MKMQLNCLEEETRFIDGSEYRGTWNDLGMEGIGKFVLPHNTIFEGEFRDGTFHGHGSIYWPRGQRADGIWFQGECENKRYIFDDGLNFSDKNWEYCKFPDRRYLACLKYGLNPAGVTLRTNKRNGFIIPPMSYDSGIGIFNPRTHCITSYRDSKKIVKIPDIKFGEWIKKNCQKAWSEPIGNRRDLYENWFSDKFDTKILSTLLPFSNNSFEPWWKRLASFQRDSIWEEEEKLESRCLCTDKTSKNCSRTFR
ncbi:MORN repeat-containing protein 5 [Anthophora quadrimaculata]